jgi:hypothetical protein
MNSVEFYDNLSASRIQLFYRTPTTSERGKYSNESVQRIRNKTVFRLVETRQKFGMAILTGFRDGDFEIEKEGQPVPIASEPNSENYYPDWREVIEKHASDLVQMLAAHVFESPAEVMDGDPEKN